MKNLFDNIKKKKDEITSSIFASGDNTDEDLKQNTEEAENETPVTLSQKLLDEGDVYYVPKDFNVKELLDAIEKWLLEDKKQQCEQFQHNDVYVVQYLSDKGFIKSLGLSHGFHLYVLLKDDMLYMDVFRSKWINEADYETFEPSGEFEKGNLFSSSYKDEISEFVGNSLLAALRPGADKLQIPPRCRYIEPVSVPIAILLYNMLPEGEILLSFFEISSVKKFPVDTEWDTEEKVDWYFVITSERIFIFAIDDRGQRCYFDDLSGNDIEIKSEIGRNTVIVKGYEWLTTLSNGSHYKEIEDCQSFAPTDRIREIARLAWHNDSKYGNVIASTFLNHLLSITENPFDELSLLFVEMGTKDKADLSKNIEEGKLREAVKKILHYELTGEKLIRWQKNWAVSNLNSIALVKVLLSIADNDVELKRVLAFHKHIREEFSKDTKDEVSLTMLELEFCRHLINTGENEEAQKLLENLLLKLPDETISELLPAEDVDPGGKNAGQFLRVSVYDLLAEIQSQNSTEYLTKASRLQPLSVERLRLLEQKATGSLKTRTQTLLSLYTELTLAQIPEAQEKILGITTLDTDTLENTVRHPAGRDGGTFEAIKKWVAEAKVPDQSIVKKYSEKLDTSQFPELSDVVSKAEKMFGLEKINCFVSRGEKHIGINAFEGEESFILIGVEHITPSSEYYLSKPELKFIIGNEFAHLYFKHARITSNDVWRGANEKGKFVLDTIMSILPGAGLLGGGLKRLNRLNRIATLLQKSEKLAGLANTGRDIFDTATQVLSLYNSGKNKSQKDDEKEKELLLTSRLMQLTADRAGLLLSGSPHAAIRSIFRTSEFYFKLWEDVNQHTLAEILNRKDDSGNYIYMNLAIRVAAIFSFYLSDEYIKLRKALIEL